MSQSANSPRSATILPFRRPVTWGAKLVAQSGTGPAKTTPAREVAIAKGDGLATATVDHVLVLRAGDANRCFPGKRVSLGQDGAISVQPYGNGVWFSPLYLPVADINTLHAAFARTADGTDGPGFVVRGQVWGGADPSSITRRKTGRHSYRMDGKMVAGRPQGLEDTARYWHVADMDKVPNFLGIDPRRAPEAALAFITSLLPPALAGVRMSWQWSSSTALKGVDGRPLPEDEAPATLGCHLRHWLSRPLSERDARELDKKLNRWVIRELATRGAAVDFGARYVDPGVATFSQPIYTLRPSFTDVADPFPGSARYGLTHGGAPEVDVNELLSELSVLPAMPLKAKAKRPAPVKTTPAARLPVRTRTSIATTVVPLPFAQSTPPTAAMSTAVGGDDDFWRLPRYSRIAQPKPLTARMLTMARADDPCWRLPGWSRIVEDMRRRERQEYAAQRYAAAKEQRIESNRAHYRRNAVLDIVDVVAYRKQHDMEWALANGVPDGQRDLVMFGVARLLSHMYPAHRLREVIRDIAPLIVDMDWFEAEWESKSDTSLVERAYAAALEHAREKRGHDPRYADPKKAVLLDLLGIDTELVRLLGLRTLVTEAVKSERRRRDRGALTRAEYLASRRAGSEAEQQPWRELGWGRTKWYVTKALGKGGFIKMHAARHPEAAAMASAACLSGRLEFLRRPYRPMSALEMAGLSATLATIMEREKEEEKAAKVVERDARLVSSHDDWIDRCAMAAGWVWNPDAIPWGPREANWLPPPGATDTTPPWERRARRRRHEVNKAVILPLAA